MDCVLLRAKRNLRAKGTAGLAHLAPSHHDHRIADDGHVFCDKAVRNKRETPEIGSHGAYSPKETARTRQQTSSRLRQSQAAMSISPGTVDDPATNARAMIRLADAALTIERAGCDDSTRRASLAR